MKTKLTNAILAFSVIVGVVLISSGIVFGNNPIINPPGGGVTPTFAGLIVNGDIDETGNLSIDGNTNVTGDVTVDGGLNVDDVVTYRIGSPEDLANIDFTSPVNFAGQVRLSGDFISEDNLRADNISAVGRITSAGKIGKFYKYRSRGLIAAPQTNLGIYNLRCPKGIAVSCSAMPAAFGPLLANYAGLSAIPMTDANGVYGCQPKMYNTNAAQNLQVYVYAVCFDASDTVLPGIYSSQEAGLPFTP